MSQQVHRPHNKHNKHNKTDSALHVQHPIPGPPTLTLSVEVPSDSDPVSRDNKLSEAVHRLIPDALERRHGILVTQRGRGSYTVQVDAEVPCGTVHEKRC